MNPARPILTAVLIALLMAVGATRAAAQTCKDPATCKPMSEVVEPSGKEKKPKPLIGHPKPQPKTVIGQGPIPQEAPTCAVYECDASVYCFPDKKSACLMASFLETSWRVCVYATRWGSPADPGHKGIAVGPVDMRHDLDPWRRILYTGGVAEIVTAYHDSAAPGVTMPTRYYDARGAGWDAPRRTMSSADTGHHGALVTLSQGGVPDPLGPTVVTECRDRGIAWMCTGFTSTLRRGHEMAVWGVFDAGNYEFPIEYTFRDDGSIGFRVGATGDVSSGQPDGEPHSHDILWRIDPDLNGGAHDSVMMTIHDEPYGASGVDPMRATDIEVPYRGIGVEGPFKWEPKEFTTILVQDGQLNALGHPMGYELQPRRTGTVRHYGGLCGEDEHWTQFDFWATRWNSVEEVSWAWPTTDPDNYLLPFTTPEESVIDEDVVLWYLDSAHHHPADEDRAFSGPYATTLMHWIGFDLHPHDWFSANPLGAPERCHP